MPFDLTAAIKTAADDAYAKYDADPRVSGPKDYDAFFGAFDTAVRRIAAQFALDDLANPDVPLADVLVLLRGGGRWSELDLTGARVDVYQPVAETPDPVADTAGRVWQGWMPTGEVRLIVTGRRRDAGGDG